MLAPSCELCAEQAEYVSCVAVKMARLGRTHSLLQFVHMSSVVVLHGKESSCVRHMTTSCCY